MKAHGEALRFKVPTREAVVDITPRWKNGFKKKQRKRRPCSFQYKVGTVKGVIPFNIKGKILPNGGQNEKLSKRIVV